MLRTTATIRFYHIVFVKVNEFWNFVQSVRVSEKEFHSTFSCNTLTCTSSPLSIWIDEKKTQILNTNLTHTHTRTHMNTFRWNVLIWKAIYTFTMAQNMHCNNAIQFVWCHESDCFATHTQTHLLKLEFFFSSVSASIWFYDLHYNEFCANQMWHNYFKCVNVALLFNAINMPNRWWKKGENPFNMI